MPIPLVAGPLLAGVGALLSRLMMAKAAFWVAKIVAMLGIAFVVDEFAVEPLIDVAINHWNALPSEIGVWIGALGVDDAVSILFSAYTIRATTDIAMRAVS